MVWRTLLTSSYIMRMISGMEEARAFLAAKKAESGLTTSAMARRLGITRVYLHLLLTGQRPVSLKLAQRVRSIYPELLLIVLSEITRSDEPTRAAS